MSGWGTIYNNMMYGLENHSQTLARLQEQIASASRVIRASDDPSNAFQIMDIKAQTRTLEVHSENLDRIIMSMAQADSVMQTLSSSLITAMELLTSAASGTSEAQRSGMAIGIDSILDQAVDLANTSVLGQYVFGGDASSTSAPYVAHYEDGKIVSVTYEGSLRNINVPVAEGINQSATLVGDDVFRSDDRSGPIFFGDTGAASGVGTSTVRGDVWLTIMHDTTTYGGATGVAAGSRSGDEDTIIGTSHTLTLDADTSKIRLDDGQFIAFTGGEVNLELTNASGDVVFVDMTSLAGGLSGMIDISINATGKMSIDDLETTVDLTAFTDNEVVTDSDTGRILYVDATQIERVGVEPVRVPGTYDLFGMLINVRDILLNDRGLSDAEQSELLSEAIESLNEVMSGLTDSLVVVGGRLQAMDTLKATLVNIKGGLDTQKSLLQDADIVELAAELARTQTFYELTLAATARVLSLSLLDYL
ncbi:MAG: flagellar hook-associated protein FlgL [Phycisphaerae bacterium]|nr:flagellar hook-associated protein FlgL [Phycisphaerae bacterium]